MDLFAVNLERFPDDQGITRTVRASISEIHPQKDNTQLFVYGHNPGGNRGMFHDGLRFDVFAACARASWPGSDPSVLKTVSLRRERSIDRSETSDFESCRI